MSPAASCRFRIFRDSRRMRFGLFCSPQSRQRRSRSGDRPGLPRLSRFQRRGRGARLSFELLGRASFHRLEPGLRHADAADGAGDAHQDAAARHRGDGAALAQSGAAGRAGGDARSGLRRPLRFRHRQGLPAQRVQGFPDRAGRGRGAFRGSDRDRSREPGRRARDFRITAASGISRTSWSSRRRRRRRIRRSGSPPAIRIRSAAPPRAASI